ncbi:MAG TPA: hypothetical protein VGL97_03390 [Bryobacteraceae bacterium]
MSIHQEADLILKLYELRREETLRKARDWFFRDFHPESMADINSAMFGQHGNYLRMIVSYWEMAAALVNRGAIGVDLFNETNAEHIGVFSKVEPFLGDLRSAGNPRFAYALEKLIDSTSDGRERVSAARQRMKAAHPQVAASPVASQR